MKENKISHRQLIKRNDVVTYLENLTKSLKEGRVVIERNSQFVSFNAPELMNMELSAKDKKDKSEITIELSWRKEPFIPDIEQLNISSIEPLVPEIPEEKESETADAKKANTTEACPPQKGNTSAKLDADDASKVQLETEKAAPKPTAKSK